LWCFGLRADLRHLQATAAQQTTPGRDFQFSTLAPVLGCAGVVDG
jgi:hypothetical protein